MYKLVYIVMTNEAKELIADQFLVVADICPFCNYQLGSDCKFG